MADKKPPASGDGTRDFYRVKTPPGGVSSQIAPKEFERPISENWEGQDQDTGAGEAHDEDTPVGLVSKNIEQMAATVETEDKKAESRLRHRVKKTAETTQQIKDTVETTNVGIDTMRFENKREIATLKTEVGLISVKLDANNTKVEKLGTDMAKVATDMAGLGVKLETNNQMTKFVAEQLPVVIKALAGDRKMTQEEEIIVRRNVLETKAHEAKAEIDDTADKKKQGRVRITGLIAGAIALLTSGAVIGFIVTHLSC